MEFENVNNYNLALEAQNKKSSPVKIFSSAARFIKKLLRRAKRDCNCTQVPRSEEEIDNDLNEQLEAKMSRVPQEVDLRNFYHITFHQTPSAQVPHYNL